MDKTQNRKITGYALNNPENMTYIQQLVDSLICVPVQENITDIHDMVKSCGDKEISNIEKKSPPLNRDKWSMKEFAKFAKPRSAYTTAISDVQNIDDFVNGVLSSPSISNSLKKKIMSNLTSKYTVALRNAVKARKDNQVKDELFYNLVDNKINSYNIGIVTDEIKRIEDKNEAEIEFKDAELSKIDEDIAILNGELNSRLVKRDRKAEQEAKKQAKSEKKNKNPIPGLTSGEYGPRIELSPKVRFIDALRMIIPDPRRVFCNLDPFALKVSLFSLFFNSVIFFFIFAFMSQSTIISGILTTIYSIIFLVLPYFAAKHIKLFIKSKKLNGLLIVNSFLGVIALLYPIMCLSYQDEIRQAISSEIAAPIMLFTIFILCSAQLVATVAVGFRQYEFNNQKNI
jgi:hypothetical protein